MIPYSDVSNQIDESGLFVPEYIAWDFEFGDSVLDAIHSKNKRKLLRKTDKIFEENSIEQKVAPITTKEHFHFLLDFFQSTHAEKNHPFVLNETWYEKKLEQHRNVESLELWVGESLVGMKMYSYDKTGFFLSHKATLRSYDEKCDIGLIIDYQTFMRAQELGYHRAETGKGKNLFGIHLQLSLYEYKVSLGLKMRVARTSKILKVHFAPASLNSPFVMLCLIDSKEQLYLVCPDSWSSQKLSKYKPVNYEIQQISYSHLLSLQEMSA